MGLFSRRRKSQSYEAEADRLGEVAFALADAVSASPELDEDGARLCSSAIFASGVAAGLFIESDALEELSPLQERVLEVVRGGSQDAIARAVAGLAWYFPLSLAGHAAEEVPSDDEGDRAWLATLHRGLHPAESLVVVTDEAVIRELFDRRTDSTLSIGIVGWFATHLDVADYESDIIEALALASCLTASYTKIFLPRLGVA